MTQQEHDAVLDSKIIKLVNIEMAKERWYPENVPFKENGEIDFDKFSSLWKEEVFKRQMAYIQNALSGDDYDMYSNDGNTPNIDRALQSMSEQQSNYIDEVPMHHPHR